MLWMATYFLFDGSSGSAPPLVISQADALEGDQVVVGRAIEVVGTVQGNVLALGGDVTVRGRVEGDVATVGGAVRQGKGSHIAGDVIVVGGVYEHGDESGLRAEGTNTLIYAANAQSLRDFFNSPARQILTPKFDRHFVGWRIAAALFSFLFSLAVIAIAPHSVSRASERLARDSLRVAVVGFVGTTAAILTTVLVLVTLPAPIAAVVSLALLVTFIGIQLYGRVVAYFLVGRWVQRHVLGGRSRSQVVALLCGVLLLAVVGSLPVVGALLVLAIFILSTGIVLTGSEQGVS
jgi:hypothetical protein